MRFGYYLLFHLHIKCLQGPTSGYAQRASPEGQREAAHPQFSKRTKLFFFTFFSHSNVSISVKVCVQHNWMRFGYYFYYIYPNCQSNYPNFQREPSLFSLHFLIFNVSISKGLRLTHFAKGRGEPASLGPSGLQGRAARPLGVAGGWPLEALGSDWILLISKWHPCPPPNFRESSSLFLLILNYLSFRVCV